MADHPRKQPYLKRNKCFQLLLIPTVNQILWHCSNSQSALWPKSGRSEHKLVRVCIRPLSSAEASLCCVGEAGEKEKERACLLPLPITKPPAPALSIFIEIPSGSLWRGERYQAQLLAVAVSYIGRMYENCSNWA